MEKHYRYMAVRDQTQITLNRIKKSTAADRYKVLEAGGAAVEAVEAAVRTMEVNSLIQRRAE